MHIPDGFLSLEVWVLLYIFSILILGYSLKKIDRELGDKHIPLMGVLAAFIFAAQMLNFPVVGGTSSHLLGAVLAAVLVGPYASVIVMSVVLIIQALVFQDGGITALGANIFNMAIIGGLSFYIVKLFPASTLSNQKKFLASVFIASWFSIILGSLACAIEIGVSPMFASAGGIAVTVPAMLFWHIIIGVGEATITTA
ncbi:MAG: energy-coupling factor ABC transporter permease, partial [Candidatus Methanofastidiosia archaeon]